jgi:phosphoribosylaminoimidazolecarboxamide formyltransferase/IMP cyclohydrolase
MSAKKITSALISVFHKDNLEPIIRLLHENDVKLFSTGGTQKFIEEAGIPVTPVEDLTSYPSILGGRVKTLHPKVFGGILSRRDHEGDSAQMEEYSIPSIDMVIVDLYPFKATVASGASEQDIIEKIDIGGISLIRAAAKNFKDVLVVSSMEQYADVEEMLKAQSCETTIEQRKLFATKAFDISSHYDSAIFGYMNTEDTIKSFKNSTRKSKVLRYGENPHQNGIYYGDLEEMFEQIHGKELSYNNLVDIDAAVCLIEEFENETAFAILKHTNACGCAVGSTVKEAYLKAFEADTISAFGGVLITNETVDAAAAEELHKLFFEILSAPDYTAEALEILKQKKNRILLKKKTNLNTKTQFKSILKGVIEQDRDLKTDTLEDLEVVTVRPTTAEENSALVFASKVWPDIKGRCIETGNRKSQVFWLVARRSSDGIGCIFPIPGLC